MGESSIQSVRIPKKWRNLAETRCKEMGARLTPARLTAYSELIASNQPLSAYELVARLEKLKQKKIAPLTAYRHLDFLISVGLVHKLESAQSYVPCVQPGHEHPSQYLMCSTCDVVVEVESEEFGNLIEQMANQHGFQPANAIVEVNGLCKKCLKKGASC
ncbi:MAG: Fur family transcriptional regulator [Gammaproteobacteria bacterium]